MSWCFADLPRVEVKLPGMVSTADIAKLYGVVPGTVVIWATKKSFPRPIARARVSPKGAYALRLFNLKHVEQWRKNYEPFRRECPHCGNTL